MAKQIDGVIEAIRFKNGQISCVRAYERRGKGYSDRVIVDRKTLLEHLQKGLHYVVGAREEFFANNFKYGKPVFVVKREGREILATAETADHDGLEGALFF